MMMHGTHNTPLVVLSIIIAICASYTALSLAGRVSVAKGRSQVAWLLGGSIAMGSGIWSMHFVAMLAFHLPVAISYDVPLVGLSHLAGVAASAFALFVASRRKVTPLVLIAAGQCLGLAIVTMHYTGMAAVRVPGTLEYDKLLVAASVVVAVGASTVALWLFLRLRHDNTERGRSFRASASVVMGLAIAGMHYTGMAAARFTLHTGAPAHSGFLLDSKGLAVPVVMGAFVILALTLLGSVTDHWVRAKLATAEALRESEERYRTVLSDIDEVIFRTDADGRWSFLNSAWTAITGFTPAESLGKLALDSVHPDDRMASLAQSVSMIEQRSEDYRRELRYLTRSGEPRWVEVHARATRDANGSLAGTAGVVRDITERRRVEEAVRAAREAAEAASRAKSEFLSRMSHELRTPLNSILGFGQLMQLEATTSDQRENATQVLKGGRHLLALINEVLDITGIESGRMAMSIEPVQISEVLNEVTALMQPLAAARRIALVSNGATGFVHADRQRFKQVLLNLLANAVKYNREGGIASVTAWPNENGMVRVTVTDNGRGIPADKVGRLFTPFERLGMDQGVEGTGLGLALSKRLVEEMKGSIGVTSTVGLGTAFWIELPEADNPSESLGDGPSRELPIDSVRPHGTILYVEDNLSNLALMQRVLARYDRIKLVPAMSGGLALDLARQHAPDLVLLDLHLPDMRGEEVLALLRKDSRCSGIPVVVLSADATPGQVDRLLAAGAKSYLTKPLDIPPFMTLLHEVLRLPEAA
jgi:PAS domain S-box-containing protein